VSDSKRPKFMNSKSQLFLAASFVELMQMQAEISAMVPGAVTEEVTNKQITTTCFAMSGEIFELAQELGWKDWKENPPMTEEQRQKVAEEFADIVAFFGLLLDLVTRRAGLQVTELVEAYFKKSSKNVARFLGETDEPGYNGFEGDADAGK